MVQGRPCRTAGLWCWVSLELCPIIMGKCVHSAFSKRKCVELSGSVHALKTQTVTVFNLWTGNMCFR
jgi:hypothetical protein